MKKNDFERCKFLGEWMNDNYEWIADVEIPEDENYYIDDIRFTTSSSTHYMMEVKAVKQSTIKDMDYTHSIDFNAPHSSITINELVDRDLDLVYMNDDVDRFKGKKIGILNADCDNASITSSKWYKIWNEPSSTLAYLGKDGVLIFNHNNIKEAFLGYGYMTHSQTKEKNKNGKMRKQLKVLLDLSKGKYIEINNVDERLLK